MMLKIV